MEYKVGDLVRLKSGGPVTTVADTDDDELTCIWFTSDHDELHECEVLAAMVELAR